MYVMSSEGHLLSWLRRNVWQFAIRQLQLA